MNAHHVKGVPGRKSDILDCQWLQQLHTFGLLRGSFRPNAPIAALRSVIRHRDQLVESAASWVQRMQKALVLMNLQLHHVLTDVTGVTGVAILRDIVAGETDPAVLARHRDPRCKAHRGGDRRPAAASDGVITATQLVIRKDWGANSDRFKDADGLVEEPRLYQFLADKHSMTTEAVRAEMLGFAEATWPRKTMELPDDLRTKGELTEEEQAKLADVACRADLQCWGDKHSLRATRPCQLAIEELALYDYEWTDGWLESKFDRFAWRNSRARTLTYHGSRIKFQNVFGAWRQASYWCVYDPNTQTVLDARAF